MLRSLALTLIVLAVVIVPVMPTPAQDVPDVRMDLVDVPAAAADQPFASQGWLQSAELTTAPFAMVAMEVEDEAVVQIRTALGAGEWSAWVDLPHQHDEGPDPSSAEARGAAAGHRTHPVFTDAADRLQVRSTGALRGLRAHLIDPFGLQRSVWQRMADRVESAWHGTPAATATALADAPAIVTREQWGADEALVRDEPVYARDVDRAFVHHTVGSNGYSQAQAPGVVRAVMAFHVEGNGWSDIGYNFLVDRFGTVYEGRAGGVERAVVGAQAGGFNIGSTGVALMGTFSSASAGPAALEAVARTIAWKADVHHFHPLGRSEATSMGSSRYPEGEIVTLDNVSGHRDVSMTACPGDVTYGQLASLRSEVRRLAGDLIVDHAVDVTATRVVRGDPDAESLTFTGQLDPPGDWTLVVTAPDGSAIHRDQGSGAEVSTVLPLTGQRWALGDYRVDIAAPGRRTATELVRFEPPVITGLDVPDDLVTADAAGGLQHAVAITADLWEGAVWTVSVTDPAGDVISSQTGTGQDLDARWAGDVTDPGTYEIGVAADDAAPVTAEIEVRYDLLPRIGDAEDAIGGAALISGATFEQGEATRAVVARHDVFADALSGGPLAGEEGPLLLTASDSLDSRVTAELDRVLAPDATIYVLGGTAAISDQVADELAARYGDVIRLSGGSRYATAAAVAEVVVARSGARTAMVARAGPDSAAPWADALGGGAYGARTGIPVLLTDTGGLSDDTAAALADLDITETIVLGGVAAVADGVLRGLPSPSRLSGDERTATGVAIAEELWGPRTREVVLVNAYADTAWAWALAAAPLAARSDAPLLVSPATGLAPTTSAYLRRTPSVTGGVLVGPRGFLEDEVGYAASDLIRR